MAGATDVTDAANATGAAATADHPDRALIERYLRVLEVERKLSAHTVLNYRRELGVLTALARQAAPGRPAPGLAQLQGQHIRRFAAQLHARGLAPRSIARALSAWRTFYTWLGMQVLCAANPVRDVCPPKAGKRLPKALPVEQAVALVAARAEEPTGEDVRDAAIRELFYSSGLRLSELVGLDVRYTRHAAISGGGGSGTGHAAAYQSAGWLDLDAGEVIVTGKGNKQRQVPVGQAALAALREWLSVRQGWLATPDAHASRGANEANQANAAHGAAAATAAGDSAALFISPRGRRIARGTVQTRLKALARRLGIPANVHPHVLRHSFASHMLQSSGDLRAVQELLGHANIASTQVYTSLDFQRLAAVYDGAHPRAKARSKTG